MFVFVSRVKELFRGTLNRILNESVASLAACFHVVEFSGFYLCDCKHSFPAREMTIIPTAALGVRANTGSARAYCIGRL